MTESIEGERIRIAKKKRRGRRAKGGKLLLFEIRRLLDTTDNNLYTV
jgi:hypothetical protein